MAASTPAAAVSPAVRAVASMAEAAAVSMAEAAGPMAEAAEDTVRPPAVEIPDSVGDAVSWRSRFNA